MVGEGQQSNPPQSGYPTVIVPGLSVTVSSTAIQDQATGDVTQSEVQAGWTMAARPLPPRTTCTNCGAIHAGTYRPYCPDCNTKSKDPNGGVPPNPNPPDWDSPDSQQAPAKGNNNQNSNSSQSTTFAMAAIIAIVIIVGSLVSN